VVQGLIVVSVLAGALAAQAPTPAPPPLKDPAAANYVVFLGSRAVGREEAAVIRQADGWVVRGTSRIGAPVDVVSRQAEIRYDANWRPISMILEGTVRGTDTIVRTSFADGKATSDITVGGTPSSKTDAVSPAAVILPNAFLGSYAALARRLPGSAAGAEFRGYIPPQVEIAIRVDGVFPERIETPQRAIQATRFALSVTNPGGDLQFNLWTDTDGALLRLSVPAQMLEVARDDIASAATRTTSFTLPNDEAVRIPATGFTLAGAVTKPSNVKGPAPALVLVGGSGPLDRDGFVAGIPVLGQMARDLAAAGFIVVRYDKRGVGQSGGRTETATLADYAEDVRAILRWLDDQKDVDDDRIGLVGHSEGAWVAMTAASRDDRAAALALVGGASTTGAELVLEQQRHMLERSKAPDADAKIALQKRINQAVATGSGWDDIPADVRSAAETPWFQSFLTFDPARVMRDIRQPVLIVQGALDTHVPTSHADKLAELAPARKRRAAVDTAIIPGVNHLLVPATTGEVDEYPSLAGKEVSSAVTSAIANWMTKRFQETK
jgi:pimeloyl-ACP methyl ester carboxylesterase